MEVSLFQTEPGLGHL